MPKLLSEGIQVGFGPEATPNSPVAPVSWLPGRSPTGMRPVLEKVLIRETRATRMNSQGSEIVQKRVEGPYEFNVRVESIGHLLRTHYGKVTTTELTEGAYQHVFEVLLNNPQHPTLTTALHQPGFQDYRFPGTVVPQLELRTPVDDLVNATAQFVASDEQEQTNYTPAFSEDDVYFRNYDVTLKLAADVSGLGAAQALKARTFNLTSNNNTEPRHYVGDFTPGDMLARLFEITGSLDIDYEGKTYHDFFVGGDYRALRVQMEREDIELPGDNHPSLTIDLPKVSFEDLTPERPLDDVAHDAINYTAHYDEEEAEGFKVTLINGVSSYAA